MYTNNQAKVQAAVNPMFGAANSSHVNANAVAAPLAQIFRLKSTAKDSTKVAATAPAGVLAAVEAAQELVSNYNELKVQVLDRTNQALWAFLQDTYTYVNAIEKSTLKRETCSELMRSIKERDGQNMPSNSSVAAIVVRYVFPDQSRQTRSNYVIAMEKATALGVTTDTFAGFLEQYGGVSKVVETVFDQEKEEIAYEQNAAAVVRQAKQSRTATLGRYYAALAHVSTDQVAFTGEVSNWVPEMPEKKAKSDKKEDNKPNPKYEDGRFVFFISVYNADTDKYHMVQGNVFDRAFEEQLIASIADRMGANTEELEQEVVNLEQHIGFGT